MAESYKLTGRILRDTTKATQMLVSEINGVPLDEDREEWFPLSQTSKIIRAGSSSDQDELWVSAWILEQKEML